MIKKLIKVLLVISILLINGCQTSANQYDSSDLNNGVQESNIKESKETKSITTIKLQFDDKEIIVELSDNSASKVLVSRLPLDVQFEDFNSTEKIATLPSELSTEGLPSGYTPKVGDFSYYAPWGNLSIFYEDFRYSNSLYKLGKIESGTEILGNVNGNFEVTIERVN